MIADTLKELVFSLSNVSDGITEIRLFLTDLYLQTRDNIGRAYPSTGFSFAGNAAAIELIGTADYLYEIRDFLTQQFELMINAMGSPSGDAVLQDVIFYIDHNFRNNIKLDAIAPLFGYNSAYLGKLFSRTVGKSFNSYVDHKRIELSKQLLLENKLKVYEIAEQAGYNNVDYFHKKFRKYVGQSPAEYRKSHELS